MLFYKEKHNTTNRRSCGCFFGCASSCPRIQVQALAEVTRLVCTHGNDSCCGFAPHSLLPAQNGQNAKAVIQLIVLYHRSHAASMTAFELVKGQLHKYDRCKHDHTAEHLQHCHALILREKAERIGSGSCHGGHYGFHAHDQGGD